MHLRLAAVVAALIVTAAGWVNIASASPGDDYVGPYYGDGNLPPGRGFRGAQAAVLSLQPQPWQLGPWQVSQVAQLEGSVPAAWARTVPAGLNAAGATSNESTHSAFRCSLSLSIPNLLMKG